jgi:predicted nucleic acid-binding protein
LTICADSSFLVSKYISDVHSAEADRRMVSRPIIWLTPLNRAELAHVMHQYVFRGGITAVDASKVWADFEYDRTHGIWKAVDLPEQTWETSIDLARRYGPTLGIRTLDSLHVACALELKARRFWTFDKRQAQLAEAVGLNTVP